MRAKPLVVSNEIIKGQGWKSNRTDKAKQDDAED